MVLREVIYYRGPLKVWADEHGRVEVYPVAGYRREVASRIFATVVLTAGVALLLTMVYGALTR